MKMLKLLLVAMAAFCSLQAQNTEADSLKKLLPNAKEDHAQVRVLEGLSYAYLSTSPDTALHYALKGLELARKIGDTNGEAICINALGSVNFHVGDYAKALELYLQALQMKEQLKIRQNLAVYYFNISNVYNVQGDTTQALYYLFKTKKEDEKAGDSSGIMFDLYSLSDAYLRMGKTDSALYYLHLSNRVCNRLDDKNMVPAILIKYGDIYSSLKNIPVAINYYHNSIYYARDINDNQVLSEDYLALARIFGQNNNTDSSTYYARKALILASEAPFLKTVLDAGMFLAGAFKVQKKYDSAFKYLELSIATKDSLFNIENVKKVQNLKLQELQRQQSIETARIEYRNKVKLYLVISASFIFLGIALVLWRNNKQKQEAYTLLQQQKAKTDDALDELRSTQSQLVLREKMASLGELTAGIAHEIQNPLNFVNNFSEVNKELLVEMKEEIDKGNLNEVKSIAHALIDNAERINQHGKRADAIVKGMLQHSRSSSGLKEPTDINALADEFLRLAYHGLRAKDKSFNATLHTDFDQGLGKINIIPQDIGRVLLNLYNNAFHAVLEKKKSSMVEYIPTVSVSTRKLGDKVEIRIKDNGIGIPEKLRGKIFQPFFTTKPTGQGTGLGLSLSYDIITKGHGGAILLESEPGEGSLFIIQLPV
ncbi:tetratricopeptide repeat-containing sensor histidine kinase [Flavihumibacter profundi]|jgi:two-component system, NtrC family, sensor kinase|uniref:tetratricopeptide repeat-containing sensor histidine kinase n=1 Tax=Flavihumibacter profundi TaxID=2716883 RepID=UPI001CC7E083|nr:ATP-binding protein [Flavihumibacter profundi]MBZ5857221.1 tetratricopeptide repeat protein [Flavihumibacter profundi]